MLMVKPAMVYLDIISDLKLNYDLPIAAGMYIGHHGLHLNFNDALMVGELALDGSLRHVDGILSLALFAK